VPKPSEPPSSATYAVHVLLPGFEAAEFNGLWHNCPVLNLHEESKAYLFARFAWTVIQRVKPFIVQGLDRNVVRVIIDQDQSVQWKVEMRTSGQLLNAYGGGGSKGATPLNKRSQAQSAADSEAEEEEMETDWQTYMALRHIPRTRKQERSSDTLVDPEELDKALEKLRPVEEETAESMTTV
jgi:hypothetical protein